MSDSEHGHREARTDAEVERLAKRTPDEYHFYVFPIYVLTLPLILAGYLLSAIGELHLVNTETNWHLYLVVLLFTLVAMGFDFEREMGFILMLMGVVITLILVIISMWTGVNIFGKIVGWIAFLNARISASALFEISIFLTVLYLLMLINVYFNHKVRVKGETMDIKKFMGRTETFKIIGQYAPRQEIPDVLEWMFCGLGSLRVTDSENNIVILGRIFWVRTKEAVLLEMASSMDVNREPDRI